MRPEKKNGYCNKKLTPELVEDYLHFYDTTPHDDGMDENTNTKSECGNCISWLSFMQSVESDDPGLKVKSIFCYVIAPEMQRKGIATKLLERVCMDAQMDGFDVVESYPKKEFVSVARDFMGPSSM